MNIEHTWKVNMAQTWNAIGADIEKRSREPEGHVGHQVVTQYGQATGGDRFWNRTGKGRVVLAFSSDRIPVEIMS